jgi:MoaA/NifB/PqqE/SkfB family radical SAM enzyme
MKRFYLAITNDCNRACECCSMYSKPGLQSYLSMTWIEKKFDDMTEEFQVQLEGGEPMVHPNYYNILYYFNAHPKCTKIIVTTNGTRLPHTFLGLAEEFDPITKPILIKPSINEYLRRLDSYIWTRCEALKLLSESKNNFELLINVRLRKGVDNDDEGILKFLHRFRLTECSNIFFFQRYGLASDMEQYEPPFIIENPMDFYLYSPDGIDFGQDLIARSNHMKKLMVDNRFRLT